MVRAIRERSWWTRGTSVYAQHAVSIATAGVRRSVWDEMKVDFKQNRTAIARWRAMWDDNGGDNSRNQATRRPSRESIIRRAQRRGQGHVVENRRNYTATMSQFRTFWLGSVVSGCCCLVTVGFSEGAATR